VHPVQLYELTLGLVLLLLALRGPRKAMQPGMMFLRVAMALAVGRYLLDYLHEDPDRGLLFGFSVTQLACLLAFPWLLLSYQQLRRATTAAPAGKKS
jgi:prolipoprotein diacylglyceryltransferase